MIKPMPHAKYFMGGIVIIGITFFGYSLEMLTDRGYTPAQIMTGRGSIALILCSILTLLKRQSLLPNQWKPQVARFFTTGASSYLVLHSYKYLSAATVSLINQLNVPIIIFLSTAIGLKKTPLQFWLSLWTILIVLYLALMLASSTKNLSGLFTL